jgi:AraC family transcriptional regulator of adaptative response/methylated-DNA-[protein]-cysteine methyltransferase
MDAIAVTRFETPLGEMVAAGVAEGVCLLEFHDRRALKTELRDLPLLLKREVVEVAPGGAGVPAPLVELQRELEAYFAGTLRQFTFPLVTPGTAWEQRVWAVLRQIPHGTTRSYGSVAEELGTPGGARAVGLANGRNRIAIVIPCHRVINADGGLHGYGGGLERKRKLLELEAVGAGLFR